MSPLDWAAWLYGKFLANHATLSKASYFAVPALSAIFMLLLWMRAIDKYRQEHPNSAQNSEQTPTVEVQPQQDRVLRSTPTDEPFHAGQARSFTKRTPRELLALYEGRTALQADKLMEPYKELWIATEGRVSNSIPDGSGVTVILRTGKDLINARFEKRWEVELRRVDTGDIIETTGKIGDIQNGQQLYLLECNVP